MENNKNEESKWCPFLDRECAEDRCAVYIRVVKDAGVVHEAVYEGCGLVTKVPWRLRERATEN